MRTNGGPVRTVRRVVRVGLEQKLSSSFAPTLRKFQHSNKANFKMKRKTEPHDNILSLKLVHNWYTTPWRHGAERSHRSESKRKTKDLPRLVVSSRDSSQLTVESCAWSTVAHPTGPAAGTARHCTSFRARSSDGAPGTIMQSSIEPKLKLLKNLPTA